MIEELFKDWYNNHGDQMKRIGKIDSFWRSDVGKYFHSVRHIVRKTANISPVPRKVDYTSGAAKYVQKQIIDCLFVKGTNEHKEATDRLNKIKKEYGK